MNDHDFFNILLLVTDRETEAWPLLLDALADRPDDGRLNFKMAEILRKEGRLDEADEFAKTAIKNGVAEAHLSRANISFTTAMLLRETSDTAAVNAKFQIALSEVMSYEA